MKTVQPVKQEDRYSCGYCAVKAVYDFLDIKTDTLWKRLRVDSAAPVYVPAWLDRMLSDFEILKGVTPFQIIPVLQEDGFVVDATTDFIRFTSQFTEGMDNGFPSLALIDNCAHWVVVSEKDQEGYHIVDSMVNGIYPLQRAEFRKKFSGGINLLERKQGNQAGTSTVSESMGMTLGLIGKMIGL